MRLRHCIFCVSLGSLLSLSFSRAFLLKQCRKTCSASSALSRRCWLNSVLQMHFLHTYTPASSRFFHLKHHTASFSCECVCEWMRERECISRRPGPLTAAAAGQRDTGELSAIKSLPPRIKSSLVAPPPISHFINMYLNLIQRACAQFFRVNTSLCCIKVFFVRARGQASADTHFLKTRRREHCGVRDAAGVWMLRLAFPCWIRSAIRRC